MRLHPYLDGRPCDEFGNDLPPGAPPPLRTSGRTADDFYPYASRAEFELADFLFREEQMSGKKITQLMDIWATFNANNQDPDETDVSAPPPPFANAADLYNTIDSTELGDIPWQAFSIKYDGELPDNVPPPSWMTKPYEVWFRDPLKIFEDQIGCADFDGDIDYAPYQEFGPDGKRRYKDMMGANFVFEQSDIIAEDPETHGATFVPVILGSDKTTVSVATGQNEYYPLYAGIGNIKNHVRRAHRNALSLIGFLAIPKADRKHQNSVEFRTFRRQLFHSSLARIFNSLKPWMTTPRVTRCADGYYRRVIYGFGPYIADYPEQALLACVVSGWCPKCTALATNLDDDQTAIPRSQEHTNQLQEAFADEVKVLWDGYGIVSDVVPFTTHFPRADIHKMLSPDLLHQIIKGTFKDHLVLWVGEYLELVHGKSRANEILADIDRRIAAAPAFPGLRRFPEGRGFKQWTGDDSKALMKVYLPAIAGHVPGQIVRTISAFLEVCYLVRRSDITEDTLEAIDTALARFHLERQIFITSGVREDFSLPRQHSLVHYRHLIQQFGAPNGLCSSITESKHIKAVKEPWRRSNRHQPLGQMLLTNQRMDKLAAARVDFEARGMLDGHFATPHPTPLGPSPPPPTQIEDDDVEADQGMTSLGDVQLAKTPARKYPKSLGRLATFIRQPKLQEYVRRFLYDQLNPTSEVIGMEVDVNLCPAVPTSTRVDVFHSAISTFYAPSDLSGIGGMHRERIRATPSWKKGRGRFDCVFVETGGEDNLVGFRGLHVARVLLFFSFDFNGTMYRCALVQWFTTFGQAPFIHIDSILRGAHLIGYYGDRMLPTSFSYTDTLHSFPLFYVSKYIDHHSHEIAF
ncbi:hypothetical protein LshimejAT787_0704670 [Lyophyllum shimeji]|uniref:Uncharacterized protein n=1 Tax=Lyophyllum shimeji TaxID=47721 RepID=A0A9P3UP44_LYOSH|nr:hypothetical protein LshimejAT787_0704670 [Lyophyllum shimeji]